MRCSKVVKLMTDFVDGVLKSGKAGRMRAHLSRCEACREEEAAARDVVAALSSWDDVRPPEDGLHRLETRLAFLPPIQAPAPVGRLRTFWLPYAAGLATAAALLLIVLPFTGGGSTTPLPEVPGGDGAGAIAESDAGELLPGEKPMKYLVDEQGNLREMSPALRAELIRRGLVRPGTGGGPRIMTVGAGDRDY